jgi:7-carboxy-7-deazaguanine synthase
MTYRVKEVFYTLQGEGAQSGRAAVFCRFSGCNLWTGRESHRATAICNFCDTDFVGTDGQGGGVFADAAELGDAVRNCWPENGGGRPLVVCTGGEPMLQVDAELVSAFHARDFEIAIETNGTRPLVPGIDWVCVSPKAGAPLVVESGNELKLVHPQVGLKPDDFLDLGFDHFFLQPMDGPDGDANLRATIDYCLADPRWRISLQSHKYMGID